MSLKIAQTDAWHAMSCVLLWDEVFESRTACPCACMHAWPEGDNLTYNMQVYFVTEVNF